MKAEYICKESLPALMEIFNRYMRHIRVYGKNNSLKKEFWIQTEL